MSNGRDYICYLYRGTFHYTKIPRSQVHLKKRKSNSKKGILASTIICCNIKIYCQKETNQKQVFGTNGTRYNAVQTLTTPKFEKEKIVWKRVGSILRFAYSEQAMLCLDSTCIATGKRVPFLTAVLNSRLSHYQLFELAPKTGTGDLIVSVQALEPLLVPPITETNQHLATQIENLADQILTAKRTNPNADVSDLENEIDQIVYLLYDLTADEIAIVEGSSD